MDAEKETGRIEAFSDGVFAIAATLLILDIKVPRDLEEGSTLTQALLTQWPSYLAFLVSFAMIGIMWVNHHRMFTYIRKVDHGLLMLNLVFLLGITIIPYPTSLVAEYLQPHNELGIVNERTATIVYNGVFLFVSLLFNILWRYAASGKRLLRPSVSKDVIDEILKANVIGIPMYGIVLLVGLVHAPASLGLSLLFALYYAVPKRQDKVRAASLVREQ